ncbi:MAG: carboxylating nicotinate-nucleotide diphosphorylase [Clostridiales bacterium]|nr:carboxylating nicotinate-nucleotide diphosphorylase [Clostridiales bacterium]
MKIEEIDPLIESALREDMPEGDITSESVVPPDSVSRAVIVAKEAGVLAGVDVAGRVFEKIDQTIKFQKVFEDGQDFQPGDILARLEGNSISLLKGERTALNFLQRLSGIATKTRHYVDAVAGTRTKILDTRKTTPTLRLLEKYAVRMGGGVNHRFSLSDMVLIKDNHLRLAGSITQAVRRAKEKAKPGVKIEVEVTNFAEAKEAVEAGASMIMLDNMSMSGMKQVLDWVKGRVPVEVSGKVSLRKARGIAGLGVDYISVGGLTHSFSSVDISMEFEDNQNE